MASKQLFSLRSARALGLGHEDLLRVLCVLDHLRIIEHRTGRLEEVHPSKLRAPEHRVPQRTGSDAADEFLASTSARSHSGISSLFQR